MASTSWFWCREVLSAGSNHNRGTLNGLWLRFESSFYDGPCKVVFSRCLSDCSVVRIPQWTDIYLFINVLLKGCCPPISQIGFLLVGVAVLREVLIVAARTLGTRVQQKNSSPLTDFCLLSVWILFWNEFTVVKICMLSPRDIWYPYLHGFNQMQNRHKNVVLGVKHLVKGADIYCRFDCFHVDKHLPVLWHEALGALLL